MYHILGFALIAVILVSAKSFLNVTASFYLDEVALIIVLGGTLATAIISFPPKYLLKMVTAPWQMLKAKKPSFKDAIEILVRTSNYGAQGKAMVRQYLNKKDVDPFLKEGIELLLLGLSKAEFKDILTERIYRSRQRDEEIVSFFRRLAKYPPALGLVGTVIGLVSLMRSVGQGADASQVGLNMALALIATLYGLALSNFILAPISEHFLQRAEDQKVYKELLLEGLLMIHEQKSALAVQEMLNSYLDPHNRVDIIGVFNQASA